MIDDLRIDSHKLMLHPHRVAQLLDGKDEWETAKSIYPLYVEVSPIGGCNHACTFCAIDTLLEENKIAKNIPRLDKTVMNERFSEMASLGIKSIMWAGAGEPLLNKDVPEMSKHAHSVGIDVAFTTNGTILKPELLEYSSWIKISLNAGTAESYAKIHRTKEKDWDRVWRNISDAVAHRKITGSACAIGVQCVLLPENSKDMVALATLSKNAGADYLVVKPYSQGLFSINKMVVNYSEYAGLQKELEELNSNTFQVVFRASSMKSVNQEIPYSKCGATPFLWAYIAEDGDVFACSAHLHDNRFKLGNINEKSFKDIWEGEERRKCYEMMKTFNISSCRKSCRMNAVNMYLWDLEYAKHKNFI